MAHRVVNTRRWRMGPARLSLWRRLPAMPSRRVESPAPAPAHVAALASGGHARWRPRIARFMESRFGVDFSGVRVHDGAARRGPPPNRSVPRRSRSASIVFGVAASRRRERRLLAHELAHVLQQRASERACSARTKPKPAAVPGRRPGVRVVEVVTGF